MITPFFRSSLLNTISLCELRGFIEYSIGLRGESNLSALIGSTVHGVMELLALAKLAKQNNQNSFVHDSFSLLPDEYGSPIGTEFDTEAILESVSKEDLLNISYQYYDRENPGIFTEGSYGECLKLVNQALVYQNGSFDPRSCNIYAAELPFEITIKEDWAVYIYEGPDGIVDGQLSLKGTIDIVVSIDENTIECIDYKTSKANNDWVTGKIKVADRVVNDKEKETSLYNDQQLMLYYYVLAHKFPDKNIIMTLYFIRLNRAFTLVFDRKTDLPRIHSWIKERFSYIKSIEKPTWIDGTPSGWKCRWCPFNTKKQLGSRLSICKYYQKEFATRTHDEIMLANANYKQLHNYGSGGSSKDRE